MLRTALISFLPFMATVADACSWPPAESPFWLRWNSEPVSVDAQCRTTNIGVFDFGTLGAAQDLGNGRVYQIVGERDSKVALFADCNRREAVVLEGALEAVHDTSCGPTDSRANLFGVDQILDYTEGETLGEMAEIAVAKKLAARNPESYFFEFRNVFQGTETFKVSRKDRFDLLCGCNLFYPNSAGASQ